MQILLLFSNKILWTVCVHFSRNQNKKKHTISQILLHDSIWQTWFRIMRVVCFAKPEDPYRDCFLFLRVCMWIYFIFFFHLSMRYTMYIEHSILSNTLLLSMTGWLLLKVDIVDNRYCNLITYWINKERDIFNDNLLHESYSIRYFHI